MFFQVIKSIKLLLPTILGLFDIFSDIYYIITEFIIDDDLKNLMIFFIVFPIFM